MSDEYFYMKIRFANARAAKQAFPKIEAFMKEGAKMGSAGDYDEESLVGQFLDANDQERGWFGCEPRFAIEGPLVFIESASMPPEADWGPLAEFIKKMFRAKAAGWISEGRVSAFDLIGI